jgi:hypothetical protein
MEKIEIEINNWSDFAGVMVNRQYRRYIYRGQKDSDWKLVTTLKRALIQLEIHHRYWEVREKSLIETFQRRAHMYLRRLPPIDKKTENWLEWLSVMQHYGAPTRLLDWTYSPFIAAFFALEELKETSCVWEIDYRMLRRSNIKMAGEKYISKVFQDDYEYEAVFPYEPKLQNERLIAQQGLFLCTNELGETIDQIIDNHDLYEKILTKYILTFNRAEIRNALKSLKMMNIDNSKLFPGIDGLSKSLSLQLLEARNIL